jgi:integrase
MAKKNQRTTCSPIEWPQFLYLLERLKRKEDFTMLMVVAIGGYLGLRVSDIRLIKWNQLINKDVMEVAEKKTGKYRLITLNQTFKEIIDYVAGKVNPEPNKVIACNRHGGPLSIQYINRRLHVVFKEFNIKNGTSSHCLRKAFGFRVYMLNNQSEASLILLSKIFNHSSIAITRSYIGLTEKLISDCYLSM